MLIHTHMGRSDNDGFDCFSSDIPRTVLLQAVPFLYFFCSFLVVGYLTTLSVDSVECMNSNLERRDHGLIKVLFRNLPGGTGEDGEKVRIVDEIRTEHLPNTNRECYRYSNPLDVFSVRLYSRLFACGAHRIDCVTYSSWFPCRMKICNGILSNPWVPWPRI
jgi:hypothetical protein